MSSYLPTPLFDINELLGEAQLGSFNLSSIHDLPESEYWTNKTRYAELESWYNGEKLNETQTQGGKVVDKYPVKVNPIRGAVYKHAYALFGEVPDDSRPLAVPILRPDDREDKDFAKRGQDFLFKLWYENHGRNLMIRNALTSQVLGGSVFKLSHIEGQEWRKIPLRLESVHPANFIGIPMAGDEFRLEEAWIIKAISPTEAYRVYGMEFPKEEMVYYIEYWTPEDYEITINGQVIPNPNSQGLFYEGEHDFGQVPIAYIPHIRVTGFYGESLISENVQGIVEELNKRVADYGDAVSDDSHPYYVVTGANARPDVYELAPGVRVIQLQPAPSITGKEIQPDMDTLGKPTASEPMGKLTAELYDHFRREAFIPSVADGEDEGSQRSALTLTMRMWPLLSHTSTERIYWGDGLNYMDDIALRYAIRKGFVKEITEEKLDTMRIERRYAPMLPRDREVFINELVNRASANLGSLEHLISLLDDIEDPTGEYEQIIKQLKEMAEIETEQAVKTAEAQAKSFAESNQGKSPQTRPESNTGVQ